MYAITESELGRLLSTSISLAQVNETLSRERASWRATSDEFVISLEASKNEAAWLRSELSGSKETSAALSNSLETSIASTASWRGQAEKSEKQLETSERSITRLADDLYQMTRSRDRWMLTAIVTATLSGLFGIMALR